MSKNQKPSPVADLVAEQSPAADVPREFGGHPWGADASRARPAAPEPEPPRPPEPTGLSDLLWTIVERRWTVVTIAGEVVAIALLYLFLATPVYRSDAVVQVEERAKGLAGLSDLSAMLGEKTPAETEIAIIHSRMALGKVVDELGLDREAVPKRFPLLGSAIARRYSGEGPAPAWLGLERYGWGGDRIDVERLDVAPALLDEPLTLTVLPGGRYRVEGPDGVGRVEGEVGKSPPSPEVQPKIQLFVSDLVARPGTQFRLTRRPRAEVVAFYQKELRIFEDGKKSGILVLSLDGPDPERTAAILNAIANAYVRQNVERKSAEASKALEFLESQLPVLKDNLAKAEAALNSFQVRKGTVDISKDTQSVLDRAVVIEKALSELEMQRTDLQQRFTSTHPTLTSLNEKVQKLRAERSAITLRMRDLPEAEIDSARLLRDLKVNNELYTLLLNKSQELRVVKSGTVGNVRILDEAVVTRKPQSPKPVLVLALSVVVGLAAGVAGAFVRKAFDHGLEDAEEIEAGTGLPVYAMVPHSQVHAELSRSLPRTGAQVGLIAAADPQDVAVESLRALRTSLQFALVEARNNVIAIGGPTPGVGKSFICANLAYLLASETNRVLLVDGDLRKGRLHRYFGFERRPGLFELLSGTVQHTTAIRATENQQLDILSTGSVPPNPAELLASQRFEQLIQWASSRYGYVVIDTPPVLAVADGAVVARLAGVNLLVLRAGQHSVREVSLALKRFAQAGAKVQGAVLNDVQVVRGRYGRHGRYHRYEYRSSKDDT
jgi:tyrosine-protein kinase Etk/Wzc